MSDSVLLRTFPDPIQAEMARSFLESEGIVAEVEDSAKLHAPSSVYGQSIFPIELRVAEADLAAAEALLKQTDAGDFEINDDGTAVEDNPEPGVGR